MTVNSKASGGGRRISLLLLCCSALLVTHPGCGKKRLPAPENFTIVELSPGDGELAGILRTECRKAGKLNRKPFVEFYADWCGASRQLRASLDDPLMEEAFNGTYLIWLNVDDWKERLAGTGMAVGVIPVFYALDDEGRPTGRKIDANAWGDNVPAVMAPVLKNFFDGTR